MSWPVPSCWQWRQRMRSHWLVASTYLVSPQPPSLYKSWTSTRVQSSAPAPSPSNWRKDWLPGLDSPPSLPRILTAPWDKLCGKTTTGSYACKCLHYVMVSSEVQLEVKRVLLNFMERDECVLPHILIRETFLYLYAFTFFKLALHLL